MGGGASDILKASYNAAVAELLLPPKPRKQLFVRGVFGSSVQAAKAERELYAGQKILGSAEDSYYTLWPSVAMQDLCESMKPVSQGVENPLLLAILTGDAEFLRRILQQPEKYYLPYTIKAALDAVGHYALLFAMVARGKGVFELIFNVYKQHGLLREALQQETFSILVKSFSILNEAIFLLVIREYQEQDLLNEALQKQLLLPLLKDSITQKNAQQVSRILSIYLQQEGLQKFLRDILVYNDFAILKAALATANKDIILQVVSVYSSLGLLKKPYGTTRSKAIIAATESKNVELVLRNMYSSRRQPKFKGLAFYALLKLLYRTKNNTVINSMVLEVQQNKNEGEKAALLGIFRQMYQELLFEAVAEKDTALFNFISEYRMIHGLLKEVLKYKKYEILYKAIATKNIDIIKRLLLLYLQQNILLEALQPRGFISNYYNVLYLAIQTKDKQVIALVLSIYEGCIDADYCKLISKAFHPHAYFALFEAVKTGDLEVVQFMLGCYRDFGVGDKVNSMKAVLGAAGDALFHAVVFADDEQLFDYMIRLYKQHELLEAFLTENNCQVLLKAVGSNSLKTLERVWKLFSENQLLEATLAKHARELLLSAVKSCTDPRVLKKLLELFKPYGLDETILFACDAEQRCDILYAALHSNNAEVIALVLTLYEKHREQGLLRQVLQMQNEENDEYQLLSIAMEGDSLDVFIRVLSLYMEEGILSSIAELPDPLQQEIRELLSEFVWQAIRSNKLEQLASALLHCQRLDNLSMVLNAVPAALLLQVMYFCVLNRESRYQQFAKDLCKSEIMQSSSEVADPTETEKPAEVQTIGVLTLLQPMMNDPFSLALRLWSQADKLDDFSHYLDMSLVKNFFKGMLMLNDEGQTVVADSSPVFVVNTEKGRARINEKNAAVWSEVGELQETNLPLAILRGIKFTLKYRQRQPQQNLPSYVAKDVEFYGLILHFADCIKRSLKAFQQEKPDIVQQDCQDLIALIYAEERPEMWQAVLERLDTELKHSFEKK